MGDRRANAVGIREREGFFIRRGKDGKFFSGQTKSFGDLLPFLAGGERGVGAVREIFCLLGQELEPGLFLPAGTNFLGDFGQRSVAPRLFFAEVEDEVAVFGGEEIADRIVGGQSESRADQAGIGLPGEGVVLGGKWTEGPDGEFGGGGSGGEVWAGFAFGQVEEL